MPNPIAVEFQTKETSPTVIEIAGPDGKKYEMKLAPVVSGVADSGMVNPLDKLPIFQVASQIVVQVKQVTNG